MHAGAGLGHWVRVWDASITPTEGPGNLLLRSWDLSSIDLHWWSYENNAWGILQPIADILTVQVRSRAVPTIVYYVRPHNRWKVAQQSILTNEQLQWRNTLVPLPVGPLLSCQPSTKTQKCSSETNMRDSTLMIRNKPLPLTGKWQSQKKRGGLALYPMQASVTTTWVTPPIKRTMASIYWEKRSKNP